MSRDKHYHCPNGCEKVVFIPQGRGKRSRCIKCGAAWIICKPEICDHD